MPKWSDFLVKPTKFSNFNISTTKRGSCSPGILYPVWYSIMNPGEVFRMNIRSLIRTNPVKSPLMGRFKVRVVTVVSNFKNYAVGLEGYRRSFDWRTFVLPHSGHGVKYDVSYYTYDVCRKSAVRETSLYDYLGYQVGWYPNPVVHANNLNPVSDSYGALYYNCIPNLVYFDFYRNYLINPQVGYYPQFVVDSQTGATRVRMFPVSKLDDFYCDVHKYYDGVNTGDIGLVVEDDFLPQYYSMFGHFDYFGDTVGYSSMNGFHSGLVSTLFDPDINTQWLSTQNYSRLQAVKVNTMGTSMSEGGQYTNFADIVKASSLWDFISREIYGGGTYADHIYSQFGVSVKSDMNIPQIVHIFDSMVDFEDITSQSETEGAVVGEQFGVGRGYGQSSRFTIRNLENNYAYAMSFMWITPIVDYASGIPDDSYIKSFTDLYSPSFDNYSMQPRFLENVQFSVEYDTDGNLSSGLSGDTVVGYQPAFSEYKTSTNRVHGLFANQLSYWTILRKVPQISTNINSFTHYPTYVYESPLGVSYDESDALQYCIPFSVESEDNFFYQLRFDIVASRPMSKSVMPHVK